MEKKTFYQTPEVELLRFAAAQNISASGDDDLVDDGDAEFDAVIPAP